MMTTMGANLTYITTSHLPYQKMGRLRYLLDLEGLINFEIKTMKLPNIMGLNDYSRNVA